MTARATKASVPDGPSPVDAWAGEVEPREHTLPSGRKMVLRRAPSLRRLVREGVIPNAMLGVVMIAVETDVDDGAEKKMVPAYEMNMKRFEEQSAAIVCAMAVEPPVVMKPGLDGALLYDLLEDDEVTYIVEWAKGGLEGAARFLEQLRRDADGEGGEVLGEEPE